MYFNSGSGFFYKVTDAGYETLPKIPDFYGHHMVAGPDGQLWVTDHGALMYSLQEGQWVFEVDLHLESGALEGLLMDNQGRLLAYGDTTGLWCREPSGQWNVQPLPENTRLSSGWSDFGQDPVFVDFNYRVVIEGDDGWESSDSFCNGSGWDQPRIQGNPQGWLVVRCSESKLIFLNYGDGWQEMPYTVDVNHVFWLDDELFATSSHGDELFR